MPIGVVLEDNKKFPLKSAPPDGFVIIRRMIYGESLQRRDMMASLAMEMRGKDTKLEMALLQEKTSLWEFSNLVVDHNITDENQRKLNFKDPNDVRKLTGKIGEEIQKYINDINSFEDSEEIKN